MGANFRCCCGAEVEGWGEYFHAQIAASPADVTEVLKQFHKSALFGDC